MPKSGARLAVMLADQAPTSAKNKPKTPPESKTNDATAFFRQHLKEKEDLELAATALKTRGRPVPADSTDRLLAFADALGAPSD